MRRMKALSLRHPYIDAILAGYRSVILRPFPVPHRGPLLLHASKGFGPRERSALAALGESGIDIPEPAPEALGALLGVARLVGCRPATPADRELAAGEPNGGRDSWAWQLADPEKFPVPIPYAGRIFLFEVPDTALAEAAMAS